MLFTASQDLLAAEVKSASISAYFDAVTVSPSVSPKFFFPHQFNLTQLDELQCCFSPYLFLCY